jgi:hypothetical protein
VHRADGLLRNNLRGAQGWRLPVHSRCPHAAHPQLTEAAVRPGSPPGPLQRGSRMPLRPSLRLSPARHTAGAPFPGRAAPPSRQGRRQQQRGPRRSRGGGDGTGAVCAAGSTVEGRCSGASRAWATLRPRHPCSGARPRRILWCVFVCMRLLAPTRLSLVSAPYPRVRGYASSVYACPTQALAYSDEKVANRNLRVWHGTTENGP